MSRIKIITDIDECRSLWLAHMPKEFISDLWDVRFRFQEQYNHRPHFVVAERNGTVVGLLPLSWNEETGQYNYFPGETWAGKTWLEQNRIIAANNTILTKMLRSLDRPYHLRYLRIEGNGFRRVKSVDEIGYLFFPAEYQYNIEEYFRTFSHKSAKRLKKELSKWQERTVEYRLDNFDDFELLCQMNRQRYGSSSYFYDARFLESFRSLVRFLKKNEWLRIVTILVDGVPAAIDMGSLYNGMLTMLAGGTDENFPGIAKLINTYHMMYACEQKLESVDFLCGDFNWKTLFHLTPNPLYVLAGKTRKPVLHYDLGCNEMNRTKIIEQISGAINV